MHHLPVLIEAIYLLLVFCYFLKAPYLCLLFMQSYLCNFIYAIYAFQVMLVLPIYRAFTLDLVELCMQS